MRKDAQMTDPKTMPAPSADDAMLTQAWSLSPSVALRPEPFGALAYHFGNRRLTFLKRPELVAVVRDLDQAATSPLPSRRPGSAQPGIRRTLPPCGIWPAPT
jgi:putative mycofactocin binding protein MftB